MKTKVIFKKITFFNDDKKKDGIVEINAIFIDQKIKDHIGLYMGYAHIGQHTEIHEDFLNNGKVDRHLVEDATEEEYADLKKELEQIGYDLE